MLCLQPQCRFALIQNFNTSGFNTMLEPTDPLYSIDPLDTDDDYVDSYSDHSDPDRMIENYNRWEDEIINFYYGPAALSQLTEESEVTAWKDLDGDYDAAEEDHMFGFFLAGMNSSH